VRSKADEKRPA